MDSINFKSGIEVEPSHLNTNTKKLQNAVKSGIKYNRSAGIVRAFSHNKIDGAQTQYLWTDGSTLGVYGLIALDHSGEIITIPGNKGDTLPLIFGLLPNTHVPSSSEEYLQLIPYSSDAAGTPANTNPYYVVVCYDKKVTGPVVPHTVSAEPIAIGIANSYKLYLRTTLLENDVVLGTVYWNSDGQVVIDEALTMFSSYYPDDMIATVTAKDDITGVVTTNAVSYFDHVNDFDNPHKVTAAQLGLDIGDLMNHQAFMHASGIRTTNMNSKEYALYPSYHSESQSDDLETITIKPLDEVNHEFVIVGGKTIYPKTLGYTDTVITMSSTTDAEGYYIIYIDSESETITKNSVPFTSDEEDDFKAFLADTTKFPICSFKWALETISIDGVDTSSYNIVAASWKDRRVFKTSSIENLHPDEVLALSQIAPNANCNYQIYNARVVGVNNDSKYNVAGKELQVTVDNTTTYRIQFVGNNPLPVSEIIYQINSAVAQNRDDDTDYYELYTHLNSLGQLVLCAPLSLTINNVVGNDAASVLGFTPGTTISGDSIQEVLISGDIEGRILFNYDAELLSSAEYWFGGNKLRKQVYKYRNDTVIRIEDHVEVL